MLRVIRHSLGSARIGTHGLGLVVISLLITRGVGYHPARSRGPAQTPSE
jgi:hypothetical protein